MPWKYLCLANAASCSLNQLHFFTSSFGLVFFGLFFLQSILKNNFKCCLHQSTHPVLCYPNLLIPCDKKIFWASLLVFLSVFTYIRASYAVPASNTNLVKLSCAYLCKAFTVRKYFTEEDSNGPFHSCTTTVGALSRPDPAIQDFC